MGAQIGNLGATSFSPADLAPDLWLTAEDTTLTDGASLPATWTAKVGPSPTGNIGTFRIVNGRKYYWDSRWQMPSIFPVKTVIVVGRATQVPSNEMYNGGAFFSDQTNFYTQTKDLVAADDQGVYVNYLGSNQRDGSWTGWKNGYVAPPITWRKHQEDEVFVYQYVDGAGIGRIGSEDYNVGRFGIRDLLAWNRVLSPLEIAQVSDWAVQQRGVRRHLDSLFCGWGDSLTAGWPNGGELGQGGYPRLLREGRLQAWDVVNLGQGGDKATNYDAASATALLARIYNPSRTRNVLVYAMGSNDLAAGVTAAALLTKTEELVSAARTVGFKVLVCTLMARGGGFQNGVDAAAFETAKAAYRTGVLASAICNADGPPIDLSATSELGVSPAYSNTTYFNDQIHLTYPSGYSKMAGYIFSGIESLVSP